MLSQTSVKLFCLIKGDIILLFLLKSDTTCNLDKHPSRDASEKPRKRLDYTTSKVFKKMKIFLLKTTRNLDSLKRQKVYAGLN